jgi:hypothetical protein
VYPNDREIIIGEAPGGLSATKSEVRIEVADLKRAQAHGSNLLREREELMATSIREARARELEHQVLYGTPSRDLGLTGMFTTPVGANPFAQAPEDHGVDAMIADGWSLQHASTWRGSVVVDCETPMVAGAHPFTRTRVTEEHGGPSSLGNWRRDDDHGSACEVKDLRVERFEMAGSTASGRSEYRAWLAPVGPVVREARWVRADGGSILARRVASGRYADRLPTNRRRKRERAKERRRARGRLAR